MSVITDTWRQMVRRRLWPVAVLLLGALVAVPVLLASTPTPAPAPAPAADAHEGLAEPVVAMASSEQGGVRRRHVLGTRKDPFQPGRPPRAPRTASTAATSTTTTPSAPSSTPTSTGGGSSTTFGGGGSTPVTPSTSGVPTAPSTPPSSAPPASTPPASAPKKTYELYSLVVRFGDATSDSLARQRLKRLEPLPDAEAPVAIYLGPGADRKSAVFLVDESVTPDGDGACKPYAADCQTVVLHKGDTEFFDLKDPVSGAVTATYELDLVDIVTKQTASASKARAARAQTSRAGSRAYRAHVALAGPLRWSYDRRTGTVARLDAKAFKAEVAHAAAKLARVVGVLQPSL